MVLRVHTTCALVPAIASTMPRVAEAMPDRWHRKFSAVRSAVRMPRAGPRIIAIRSPGASRLPSGAFDEHLDRRIDQPECSGGEIQSCHHAGLACHQRGLGARARGHDRIRGQVAGAAEVLQQRGAHRRLDHDGGKGRWCHVSLRCAGGTLSRRFARDLSHFVGEVKVT